MARNRITLWPAVTMGVIALALLIAIPQKYKTFLPGIVRNPALHLGLDMAGGTQLDFRISEEEIRNQEEQVRAEIAQLEKNGASAEELNIARAQLQSIQDQKNNLVEAIRTVLEKRINALGVSEATITPSYVGSEKHLLVECPGVIDVQECIKVVGKTIQLEFKEQQLEATDEYRATVRKQATDTLKHITQSGSSLTKEGENLSNQLGVSYQPRISLFRDQLPKGLEGMWNQAPGTVRLLDGVVENPVQNEDGSTGTKDVAGIFLVETIAPPTGTGRIIQNAVQAFEYLQKNEPNVSYKHHEKEALGASVDTRVAAAIRSITPGTLKEVKTDPTGRVLFLNNLVRGGEEIEASHILITYAGAAGAEPGVTRTKDLAKVKADEVLAKLKSGSDFTTLARTESDGPSRKDGGKLGAFGRGIMAPAFETAAFALKKPGDFTEVVETQFGFHIIRLDKAMTTTPDLASYDELIISGSGATKRSEDIAGRLQRGEIRSTEQAVTLRLIFFSLEPTGWKDTQLDGKHFRSAVVMTDPTTNFPVVQIIFDAEGARLFQELTKKNIDKQLAIFVGGELVSAPRVQQEITGGIAVITGSSNIDEAKNLAQDLNTGAIPAPIYLAGQYTVEATLGEAALQSALMAALIGVLILMVYMIVVYRLLGLIADLGLAVYAVLFTALLKLPLFLIGSDYIVLTLAGMAGIILSLGMAVDANVLVFERMKEDLRKGKSVRNSIDSSFKHAWPAIRDGNISTLITCGILFVVGTSIIRGFAITLSMGILLSLFTAVTVSRWLLHRLAETPLMDKPELFGGKKNTPVHPAL